MARAPKSPKHAGDVAAFVHKEEKRRNIPTAELQSLAQQMEEPAPLKPVHYPRATPLPRGESRPRDADRDPQLLWRGVRITLTEAQRRQLQETGTLEIGEAQLVWRGKDLQDWSDLVVTPPPIYIQEKVHPKAIIDGLRKEARARLAAKEAAPDLFADFNGLDDPEARLEFYQHEQHWSNRMILGDSLQVMASLAEREGLRGKVQAIYFDPPYGIKFNSNWQVSTLSRDVKDGKREDVSREPEQVKAFRDTWKDGIHSYLTYLRDRLTVARELLTESGSIFVQIGDENVHRVRAVMDEVFGAENIISQICFKKTAAQTAERLAGTLDYILYYAKSVENLKYRQILRMKEAGGQAGGKYVYFENSPGNIEKISDDCIESMSIDQRGRLIAIDTLVSQRPPGNFPVIFRNNEYIPRRGYWKTGVDGFQKLIRAGRVILGGSALMYKRYLGDFPCFPIVNIWEDTSSGASSSDPKVYVVQTQTKVIERCLLMATDPGDLVLDPTCGSGTTATVAEQWGRRWITIDTSRVALALARTRLMSAKYLYYLLADSREGRAREQDISGRIAPDTPTHDDLRQGFVYQRAPHVTLKSIANNAEIDVLWEEAQQTLEPLRARLNAALGKAWEEWEIPCEADPAWPAPARRDHAAWWEARIERQKRIDASIARKADIEYLYDRPYEDRARVRVAGPFTVESLSPHRVVPADADALLGLPDAPQEAHLRRTSSVPPADFAAMVLEHLRTAGVQQSQKGDAIRFTSLVPWPGNYIGAEGHYLEGDTGRRAGILIGPEFGTLTRLDLTAAAREASEARFDVLIACAFSYDAHASELTKLGPLPILKAHMNPDLHMAGDLKNTGKGNLFVVFGEPDIKIEPVAGDPEQVQIRILGVDVFDPQTGEIRSGDTKSIAAWFIDTEYDEESFRVRHAYFLGAGDPYKSLKAALRAEIDEEAWSTLYRAVSRPFPRPETGRVAVKVINHFGDEVMKVFTLR